MKISEVCAKTGLTDRAVRFYIEKELIHKDAKRINGRDCREYDEEDVCILRDIAILRSADFSIQNIIDMQKTPEKIPVIVEEKYGEISFKHDMDRQLLDILGRVRGREGISWRRLAAIIENHVEQDKDNIVFHWPDNEAVLEENSVKGGMQKALKRWLIGVAAVILVIGIITASLYYLLYREEIVVITTLSEVTFCDKWVEDGGYYVTIQTNQRAPIGLDTYFFEPKTLKLEGRDFYQAVVLKQVSYMSVTLRINISYGEAKKQNLLKEGGDFKNRKLICVEKVLEDNRYIKDYCEIIGILP